MNNSTNFSPSHLSLFLNSIGYTSNFSFSPGQVKVLESTKIDILERNLVISLPEAESKYSKTVESLNKHFNSEFTISSLYCHYLKLTSTNISLCQFLNYLILLELILTNFNDNILKINIDTILSEKISLYQIDLFQQSNQLDNLFDLINAQEKEENKNSAIVVLLFAFSICDQIDFENLTYNGYIKNIAIYNKAYFSHASFALLEYFLMIIYTNLFYVSGKEKNKGDSDTNNLSDIPVGMQKINKKNSNHTIAFDSRLKSHIKMKNSSSFFIPHDTPNFYLLDNDTVSYPYTDTIKPLMFQSYLKLFVIAHISKINIKTKINLTIQNPILLLKTNMNNLITSSSSSKLFTSQDINIKSLTFTKVEILTKEKIAQAFKSFTLNDLCLQVIGFNTVEQIKNIINIYASVIVKAQNCYIQEPANTVEEYISIEMLFLEWSILEELLLMTTKNKDIKKSKISNFSFRFNAFKVNISKGGVTNNNPSKEIKLYFNYSIIKEKTLFVYFKQRQNLISLINRKIEIISTLDHFKNYNIGVRIFQNNFRSHQLQFYLQIITKEIINYVHDSSLKHVTIYEEKFSNYIESMQCFIKDPNHEKKKRQSHQKFRELLKKVKSRKFKVLSFYVFELVDLFDYVIISEDVKSFNLLRTYDDNKIFFILKKNENSISTGQTTMNAEESEIIEIYMYFSNKKEVYERGLSLIQLIKTDLGTKTDCHITLICDKNYLESTVINDVKIKKTVKLLYQLVDDIYMIAKSGNNSNDKKGNSKNESYNYDIYIADNYIAIANFQLYDYKNDVKYANLINDFIDILSSCIELILYILKNKDIYIPRFIFLEKTMNERYFSFEYKSCNIFIKELKSFDSLFNYNFKNGIPLFCLISKKENSEFTFSNDNFYDVFLRLFLNLNKVVDEQNSLNEIFMQKIHKNLFFEYYDSFYPIFFSYSSYLGINEFFLGNNYLQISKNENFVKSYLIPFEKFSFSKHKSIFDKKLWMSKKLNVINFNFSSDCSLIDLNTQMFTFKKVEFFLNEIEKKCLIQENKRIKRGMSYVAQKIKDRKNLTNIFNFLCCNGYLGVIELNQKLYEELIDSYLKEKERIKTQKVELRVIQLTENVLKPNTKNYSQTYKDGGCTLF